MGTTYPPLLLAAAQTLQVVLLNAWPRLAPHQAEVLRGLTLCWRKIVEEEEEEEESSCFQDLESVKLALRDSFRLLNAVLDREEQGHFQAQMEMLLESQRSLKGLLLLVT